MKLIIGLGNPGEKYDFTRHNFGFMFVDFISSRWDVSLSYSKFDMIYGKGIYLGNKVIICKAMNYINRTGPVLLSMIKYFNIDICDIIVVSDDVNISFERIRIRAKGSAGGHNGLKSIISSLGTDSFIRIRLGVGGDFSGDLAGYVLSRFNFDERNRLDGIFEKVSDILCDLFDYSLGSVMSKYGV